MLDPADVHRIDQSCKEIEEIAERLLVTLEQLNFSVQQATRVLQEFSQACSDSIREDPSKQ